MKRTRVLALAGLLIFIGIFPTLADELNNVLNPDPTPTVQAEVPSEAPSISPTDAPSPTALSSPEPVASPNADSEISPSPSPSPSETPAAPLETQPRFVLRFPTSSPVDPRARAFFLPAVFVSADSSIPTLACIRGNGTLLDVGVKGHDDGSLGGVVVKGDMSDFLVLQGTTAAISQAINSNGGLKIYTGVNGVANHTIAFQFVGLNKAALDTQFCGAATSVAWTTLRAIGLDQNVIKGSGVLKR